MCFVPLSEFFCPLPSFPSLMLSLLHQVTANQRLQTATWSDQRMHHLEWSVPSPFQSCYQEGNLPVEKNNIYSFILPLFVCLFVLTWRSRIISLKHPRNWGIQNLDFFLIFFFRQRMMREQAILFRWHTDVCLCSLKISISSPLLQKLSFFAVRGEEGKIESAKLHLCWLWRVKKQLSST